MMEAETICRLCALECQPGRCVELFDKDTGEHLFQGLVIKIRRYLRIKVHKDDGLPQQMCLVCKEKLLDFQKFSIGARRTQAKLRSKKTTAALDDAIELPAKSTSILHAILSQTQTTDAPPSSKRLGSPPPLVPLVSTSYTATDSTATDTQVEPNSEPVPNKDCGSPPAVSDSLPAVLKEEVHDSSYDDITNVTIKEEPLDTFDEEFEAHYQEEMEKVTIKEEVTDEEDLEVTLDPAIFLDRDDNSNSNTVTLTQPPDAKLLTPNTRNSAPLPGSSKDSSPQTGGITLKKISQLKNNTVRTRTRTVFLDKKNGPKPYQCAICPRGYNSDIGLQNHLWSHRKILKSSDTGNKNTNWELLTGWRKERITASNLLTYNNAMFSSEIRSDNLYQCPLCCKKINTKANLRRHLQAHKPKGKHTCQICYRVFKSEINLTRHIESHDSQELSCTHCNRVYPTNSTLRAHMISHSSERPYNCPYCDKNFKRNQDLKFHLNQHTGERPYKCAFCPKTFASSGNCFSHRKRMHPTESASEVIEDLNLNDVVLSLDAETKDAKK
uniref:Zinc finger protein 358 n=1 Tax=Cacopsylla melanoneura TaxID=428564 RepID=A0A8D9B5V3_9HEMI